MACVVSGQTVPLNLVAYSQTPVMMEAGNWRSSTGVDAAQFVVNILALSGDSEVKPGIQVAVARTDRPDSPTVIASGVYSSASGFNFWSETVSAAIPIYRVAASNSRTSTTMGRTTGRRSCRSPTGGFVTP